MFFESVLQKNTFDAEINLMMAIENLKNFKMFYS